MRNKLREHKNVIGAVSILTGFLSLVAVTVVMNYQPRCEAYEYHNVSYCSQEVWGGTNHWSEPISK